MRVPHLTSMIAITCIALGAPGLTNPFECDKMNLVEVKLVATIEDYRTCLDNGFDPNTMVWEHTRQSALEAMSSVSTPEHLAADVVRLFLERGADPDGVIERGITTPLSHAVSYRWLGWRHGTSWRPETTVAVVTALLEYGADPNIRNRANPDGRQSHGRPPSIVTTMNKHSLDSREMERLGVTPLMLAVRENEHESIVQVLLEHGADPNMATHHEHWTSLHIGAWRGNPRIIQVLFEHGADPTAVTSQRMWTPLHILAWSGGRKPMEAVETMKLLIDAGVDPAARDAKGRTAWDIIDRRHGKRLKAAVEAGRMSDATLAIFDQLRRAGNQ